MAERGPAKLSFEEGKRLSGIHIYDIFTKQGDNRPYVTLQVYTEHTKTINTCFLVDTGSQVTLLNTNWTPTFNSHCIMIEGVTGNSITATALPGHIIYRNTTIDTTFYMAKGIHNILGMDSIHKIFQVKIQIMALHKIQASLAELKIEPIQLPEPVQSSFTPQYPLRGGHEDITKAAEKLLAEDIIEIGRSHIYNSPIWPVKKPSGEYRITID